MMKTLARYLKIYWLYFKFSLILSTQYRFNFFVEIIVEVGYQTAFLLFFNIIYGKINEIAGWNYNQMLFLIGLNQVASEIILGIFFIFNLSELPQKIKDGSFDFILLKPVNNMFTSSMERPYFTSFIAMIPGTILMFIALSKLQIEPNILQILGFVIIFICGIIICFSIMTSMTSLCFIFVNAPDIPRVGEEMMIEFKGYPYSIYQGIIKVIFLLILPVVFISSVPASVLIKEFNPLFIILAIILAVIFFYLNTQIWKRMVNRYSSASS